MKAAIIGAGISGLSCAIGLERYGIKPVIFEKTKALGDKPEIMAAFLRLFHVFYSNPMNYVHTKLGINLFPVHPIDKLVMVTSKTTIAAKGNHGYAFFKGLAENSLEHQLATYIDSPISFDTDVKIQDVRYDYDYVIVAAGDETIPRTLHIWTPMLDATCRLATLAGDFDRDTLTFYLNKNYAKNGYGYMLAKSDKEANLLLAVSDITSDKLDFYWNEFIITENIRYKIVRSHDFQHKVGYPSTNQLENMYFTGNCGGMLDDFLGFGIIRGMASGFLAARAIAEGLDYNKLMRPYHKMVRQMHEYRKMLDVLTDKDYDMDLSLIGLPGLKQLIYNNLIYKARYGVIVPKTVTLLKKKNYPFRLIER